MAQDSKYKKSEKPPKKIKKPEGLLGVLMPGMGAVTTTFMAGVEVIRRGELPAFGSLTQMGHIRLGRRDENRQPLIKELLPLAELNDLVYCCWDIFPDNAYDAACHAKVLSKDQLDSVKDCLDKLNLCLRFLTATMLKSSMAPMLKRVKTGGTNTSCFKRISKHLQALTILSVW